MSDTTYRPLYKRASFWITMSALSLAFIGLMFGKVEGSDFTFIALAAVGGQQAVNYRERIMQERTNK